MTMTFNGTTISVHPTAEHLDPQLLAEYVSLCEQTLPLRPLMWPEREGRGTPDERSMQRRAWSDWWQLQQRAAMVTARLVDAHTARKRYFCPSKVGGLPDTHAGGHSGLIDHAWYLRCYRRPHSILTHTYMPGVERIQEVAASRGLHSIILPVSSYHPLPACTAVLLTRRE